MYPVVEILEGAERDTAGGIHRRAGMSHGDGTKARHETDTKPEGDVRFEISTSPEEDVGDETNTIPVEDVKVERDPVAAPQHVTDVRQQRPRAVAKSVPRQSSTPSPSGPKTITTSGKPRRSPLR
jgi:hypothetical protein